MLMFVLKGVVEDSRFLTEKCVFIGPDDQCVAYVIRNRDKARWSGKSLRITSGNGLAWWPVSKDGIGIYNNEKVFKAYRPKKRKKK
jgi:hypothetical protein